MHLTRHRRQQKMQWLLYLTNLNRKIRLYLRRNAVIKGILFDKDGTLLKFDELWNEATKNVVPGFLNEIGIDADKKNVLKAESAIGKSIAAMT